MALLRTEFFSISLGMCTSMDVLMPEGKGLDADAPLKTLLLLHGMGDDHTAWQRFTSIERYAKDLNLAVVMPEAHLSWYCDMYRGGRFWTYIAEELPETLQQFFPALSGEREDRFAAGLSMGGYGALKLGLRAGDRFSRVASLSGGLDAGKSYGMTPQVQDALINALGPEEAFEGSFNDLFAAAEEQRREDRPAIFQWCGTEDFLYDGNIRMRDHLMQLGYDLTYRESPGDHQWKYWDEKIRDVLAWLFPGKEIG